MRKALRRGRFAVRQIHRVDFDRIAEGTPRVDDAMVVGSQLERVDRAVQQHLLNGTGVESHAEDGIIAFDRSVEVERLRVRGPLEGVDPVAERLCKHARRAGVAVENGQTKQVGFIAGLFLHLVGNVFSVGRIFRMAVESRIRSGDVARRLVARELTRRERHDPHVAVGG